jgi:short-subunit dehydrogenase
MGVFATLATIFSRENELDDLTSMVHLNALTPMVLTKLVVQDMLERGSGKILFTASTAAVAPTPNLLAYSATKAFIYHLAEGLRDELRDTGITVTALLPGTADTDFFARAGMEEQVKGESMDDPAYVAQVGYDALMSEDDHIVVSMKNKLQVAMAKVLPFSTATSLARE